MEYNNCQRAMRRIGRARAATVVAALALAVIMTVTLVIVTACAPYEPPTKEELTAALDASQAGNYSYAASYLDDWSFPRFDAKKLREIEYAFLSYYVEETQPPYAMALATGRNFVEDYYDTVDLTDKDAVTTAIIHSYVAAVGDDYAVYRTPSEYDNYETDMSGEFYGIGITIEYNYDDGTMMIIAVTPDSPAEAAGFLPGDCLYAVGGALVSELGYDGTASAIRGEQGTAVTVTVKRGDDYLDLTATRDKITEYTVYYEINDDGLGYIQITQFKGNTAEQFEEALKYMQENNALGIIFDVRSNPGGYLDSVLDTLEYLVPAGVQLASYEYLGVTTNFKSERDDLLDVPCVVLCNEYTASAGELFTAAIRDFTVMGLIDGCVVGTKTFGKGIMQNTYPFIDGSTLTMTVAYYCPPSGINYHGEGITPNTTVELTDDSDRQLAYAIIELEAMIYVENVS